MSQLGHTSRELRNTQVVVRFVLRIVVICVFATLGGVGFARSSNALLWMSAVMSATVGIVRRESIFDSALNYWDEAAAYASLCCLASLSLQAGAS
jgi:hypothetical protein